ncbi:MFS transporter [Marinicrinis sediminis]|uniref:MFS transporter n=1 Tax=Marinicrinis sediminis TaxID=1652465 RepID=A0ABW5REV0_9BACL
MPHNRIRFMFMAATTLLIVIVLSLTGALNISAFKKNYTESLTSNYAVLAEETVKKIEYAVKYGKPLTNFQGMEVLLQELKDRASEVEATHVVNTEGAVIYDEHGRGPADAGIDARMEPPVPLEDQNFQVLKHDGNETIYVPIHDRTGEWIGSLAMGLKPSLIAQEVNPYMWKLMIYLGLFAAAAVLLLVLFLYRFSILSSDGSLKRAKLLTVIFLIIGLIQISFGVLNYTLLKDRYLETVKQNTSIVLNVIQQDIENVLSKGVSYQDIYGLGDYMNQMIDSIPEIERVSIMNTDFTTEELQTDTSYSVYTYTVPLVPDAEQEVAYMAVVDVSKSYIASKTLNSMLDTGTMVIISFLLLVEITLILLILLYQRIQQHTDADRSAKTGAGLMDRTIVRPLGFLVFASVYLSSAFIPVLMKDLYEPILGLSEDIVLGLPISAEMLMLAISSILAGYWIDKKGWKPSFLTGMLTIGLGLLLSAIAWDALVFIGARAVVGVGFGLTLMAMQAFTVTAPTEEAKNEALAALNSGAYAGINCGVVIGAMVADHLGFTQVFLIGVALSVLGFWFAAQFIVNTGKPVGPEPSSAVHRVPVQQDQMQQEGSALRRFITDRSILFFFLLVIFPVAIGGMFLYYYFPLYAESVGTSPSNVGRAFLLNGLCIVFLGPLLSKYAERYLGAKMAMFVSGCITVLALAVFAISGSMLTAFVAVILLGIAEGFGITAQINYFTERPITTELGEGKAMGYYSLIENAGQMIGPLVFGLFVTLGASQGVGLISVMMLAALLLFAWLTRQRKRSVKGTSIGGEV